MGYCDAIFVQSYICVSAALTTLRVKTVTFQQRLSAFLRGLSAAKLGSITVLLAISLPVLLGIVGLAAESAVLFELRRRAQTAADAAAVAGAIQRARGDSTNVLTSAKRAATQNGFTTGTS